MSRLGFQGWGGNHSSPWLYLVFVFIWKRLSVRLLKFAFCCPLQQHMFWGKRFVPTGVPLSRVLVPAIPTLLEPHRDSCHPSSDFGGRWSLVGSGGVVSGWWEPWGQTLSSVLAAGPRSGDKRTVLTSTGGDEVCASLWGCMDLWGWWFASLAWVGLVKEGLLGWESWHFLSGLFFLPLSCNLISPFPPDLPSCQSYSSCHHAFFSSIFLFFSLS